MKVSLAKFTLITLTVSLFTCSNISLQTKEINQEENIQSKIDLTSSILKKLKYLELNDTNWELVNFEKGSCYFDTIVSAIWIRVIPDQLINKFSLDSTYIFAMAEIVNKSPKDIFIEGDEDGYKVAITKRFVKDDESPLKENEIVTSAGRILMGYELATTSEDRRSDPFKDVWSTLDKFTKIPAGSRKLIPISLPKREASLRAELHIYFNKVKTWFACDGTSITHTEYLESNVVDLVER